MIDTKSIWALIIIMAVIGGAIYILIGDTKKKIWNFFRIVGFTIVLFKFVFAPLGDAGDRKFLGDFHRQYVYNDTRYGVVEDKERNVKDGFRHPKLLEDFEQGNVLIGKDSEYLSIDVRMYDSTIVACCSPSNEGYDYFIIADGKASKLKKEEFRAICHLWRGNIMKISKKTDNGDFIEEYYRTDGKPVTFMQRMFIHPDVLAWSFVILSFVLSVLIVRRISKTD